MSKKKIFIIVVFIVFSVFFSSCSLFLSEFPIIYEGPIYDETNGNNGFMLVQYDDFLYKIGGYDSDGVVTDSVSKSKIIVNDDGEVIISEWVSELPLPAPRAHGAVFAVGNYIYVIGGEDENGPVSTVFVTRIGSNGTLGNGRDVKYWSIQNIKLPEPRSHMSLAYNDGRFFLIGGKNGDEVFDTILQARIQIGMSGHIGHWNTAPVNLPSPIYDTSVIINQGNLYVASGISSKKISNSFFSYEINKYGRLSNLDMSPLPIPEYLIKPIIVNSADSIMIGGGYTKDGDRNYSWYKYDGIKWNLLDYQFSGDGPMSAQVGGCLIVFDYEQKELMDYIDLNLPPKRPNIYPGSGLVRDDSEIIWENQSWDELSYINKTDGNESNEIFLVPDSAPILINGASLYQFKNRLGTNFTYGFPLFYTVCHIGTFLPLSGRLHVEKSAIVPFSTLTFDEISWYKLAIYLKKDVLIQWTYDSDSQYTHPNSIALFEEDFCTEVLDNQGFPVSEPSSVDIVKSDIIEWHVSLNPGIYYLKITGTSDTDGDKIGFLISEEQS